MPNFNDVNLAATSLDGLYGVHPDGKYFDELFEDLNSRTSEIGDHADLIFERGTGIQARAGYGKGSIRDFFLRFFRSFYDGRDRRRSYADAAEAIAMSIDRQHPNVMRGDLTLGEYIIHSVLKGREGEYRVNRPSLLEIQTLVDGYKQNPDAVFAVKPGGHIEYCNSVKESRLTQNGFSSYSGRRLMKLAVGDDLETHYEKQARRASGEENETSQHSKASNGPAATDRSAADIAKEICNKLDPFTTLSSTNLLFLKSELEKRGCREHPKLDNLYNVLGLRESLEVSRQHCMDLNKRYENELQLTIQDRPSLLSRYENAINTRRLLIRDLRNLRFPTEIADPEKRKSFYLRLLDCSTELFKVASALNPDINEIGGVNTNLISSRLTALERPYSLARDQAFETLSLAASVRPPRYEEAFIDNKENLLRAAAARDSLFQEQGPEGISKFFTAPGTQIPRTLYRTRKPNMTSQLVALADRTAKSISNVGDKLKLFLSDPSRGDNRAALEKALEHAIGLNGLMISSARRRYVIGRKEDERDLNKELSALHVQREKLNHMKLNLLFAGQGLPVLAELDEDLCSASEEDDKTSADSEVEKSGGSALQARARLSSYAPPVQTEFAQPGDGYPDFDDLVTSEAEHRNLESDRISAWQHSLSGADHAYGRIEERHSPQASGSESGFVVKKTNADENPSPRQSLSQPHRPGRRLGANDAEAPRSRASSSASEGTDQQERDVASRPQSTANSEGGSLNFPERLAARLRPQQPQFVTLPDDLEDI